MSELLPCPFCGGASNLVEYPPHSHSPALVEAIGIADHPGSWAAECQHCGCGLIHDTEAEAVTAWNTRASQAEIERLTKALERLIEAADSMGWSTNSSAADEAIADARAALSGSKE